MENNPNYFAILPANVRYDKSLIPNAKLLYGEITALSNQLGYCYASNQYFADLYNVNKVTISKWIKQLIVKGYITTELIYREGSKEIVNRYIRIVKYPINEMVNTPINEKAKDNNTSMNNTVNNTYSGEKENIPYKLIIDYLNEKTGSDYGYKTKETRSKIQARWNEGFRLEEFKKAIDNSFEFWSKKGEGFSNMKPKTIFNGSFENRVNGQAYNFNPNKKKASNEKRDPKWLGEYKEERQAKDQAIKIKDQEELKKIDLDEVTNLFNNL